MILQELVVLYTALITLIGGTPVAMPEAISTVPLIVEEQTESYNVDMATTTPKRDVKVYSRPNFIEKPKGSFKPDVTDIPSPAKDEKVKVKDTPTEITIPATQTEEVRYSVVPQTDAKLKKKDAMTLDELRDYVLKTNPNVVAFRKKMQGASAEELVNYLVQNGFTVIEN